MNAATTVYAYTVYDVDVAVKTTVEITGSDASVRITHDGVIYHSSVGPANSPFVAELLAVVGVTV